MRYISTDEYQSKFNDLYTFLKEYKGHPSYVYLKNVVLTKIKYDEFQKSFQFSLHNLKKEAKEHHDFYMSFERDQFDLSSDDYYSIRGDLEYKIDQLPKRGKSLAQALSVEKRKLKESFPEVFNSFESFILKLSIEKQNDYDLICKELSDISEPLSFIIRSFASDNETTLTAFSPLKNSWNHHKSVNSSIKDKKYFFHYVNELNVSIIAKSIDFSYEEILKTPLTELMEFLSIIYKETDGYSDEAVYEQIKNNNMKSEIKILKKMIGIRDKMEKIFESYEKVKNIDMNYKLIVLK